ncbi:fructosamine kinase family protein [Bacteriovoracaceae bacterium]|nr:fructosamine kinase family protein [Bacteriovoracaceae bacterium]
MEEELFCLNEVMLDLNTKLSSNYQFDVQLSHGGLTQVYVLFEKGRGKAILKVGENATQLIGERNDLQLLKDNGYLFVPEVMCAQSNYTVFEYISNTSSPVNWTKFGESLAKMHYTSTEAKFGNNYDNYLGDTLQVNDWCNDWGEFFWQQRIKALLIKISKKNPTENLSSFFNAKNRIIDALSAANETPSFIHGDLWSGNYIASGDETYLIDPAGYYAHREMEFGMITLFGAFDSLFFDAYQSVYPFLPRHEKRIKIYQLYHLLNHFLLFEGNYLNQAINKLEMIIKY